MRLSRRPPRRDPGLLLARSICHELRPPMVTLAGLLRALEQGPAEPRRIELTRLAAEHVTYAEAVLGQAARTAWGFAGGPVEAAPLGDVLPAVVSTVPPGTLTVAVSRAALRWPVHPGHTQQILINLVGNAVRHGAGPVRLGGRVRGRRLQLAVRDRGGPTPELATALRRRTPPPGARGLGLWVVRGLLAEVGGSVRARRLLPGGLEMQVTVPRHH